MAAIRRPSQVTGWPIRANSGAGQPNRASTAIATAIAPAKPTQISRLAPPLLRKTAEECKPLAA
ncbi:hypothetical protein BRDID11004_52410 [Bradyrhizobium diazoefficiens]|uniref:Uncharacterized protein n=1 Tax=Bradyrhizobium diazoefficiens TaxID=1355477 RepID=A0A809YDH0_9BRAD|nr:hypothetical protein F07S3_36910 [Bradyrhizobium diazoefficiens]BCA02858.1 hypothetical protein H12S4_37620 [Bradyrhizobium diazoefficiens]BCA11608.1 hypothetical protein BDHF08_34550 [Bradyrhizobium diazoefficiens]BCA20221.1 hypothetical protein BDHH15_34360 [Bradyrhizobium diazoefficiens]BCE20831.1 hypothetical protein XF1B_35120 [Bradyrhizobium diazoefficiens]